MVYRIHLQHLPISSTIHATLATLSSFCHHRVEGAGAWELSLPGSRTTFPLQQATLWTTQTTFLSQQWTMMNFVQTALYTLVSTITISLSSLTDNLLHYCILYIYLMWCCNNVPVKLQHSTSIRQSPPANLSQLYTLTINVQFEIPIKHRPFLVTKSKLLEELSGRAASVRKRDCHLSGWYPATGPWAEKEDRQHKEERGNGKAGANGRQVDQGCLKADKCRM